SVTATYTRTPKTLTVGLGGTGSGSVSSTPAGINCGSDCSETYAHGTSVALTPSPAAGSSFTGWSGACTGTGACTVTMDQARSVTASFGPTQWSLTVTRTGDSGATGTVTSTPGGISCGATCSASYANGTDVTLQAAVTGDNTFLGWSGACTGTGSCVVEMDQARAVTATIGKTNKTLTVARSGAGIGTVTSTPAGINRGTTC